MSTRYGHSGALTDLEEAISAFQQAVQATPPGAPDLPRCLNNLGTGLRDRYQRTGALGDLESAILAFRQAVQATPLDSPERSRHLTNLGTGLHIRYQRTGVLENLEEAITVYQQAVQITPLDSPERPGYLSNLGLGLSTRYGHSGALTDLEEAISAFQQAVQATPPSAPDLPRFLNNLGLGLRDRYWHTGAPEDLEAAISAFQQATQAIPLDNPGRHMCLANLGDGLLDRYLRSGILDDLDQAITALKQAVQATPLDSPSRPGHLTELGIGLFFDYRRTGELADLDQTITTLQTAWSASSLSFAALPVAYQLGQQRKGANIAALLVSAYLIHAKRRHLDTQVDRRSALKVAEGNKSRLLTQLVGRGPLPLPVGLAPQVATREQQLLADLIALDTQELASHDLSALIQEETSHLHRLEQRQADLNELEDLWDRISRLGPEGAEYVALRRGDASPWQELASLAKKLGPATALLSLFTTADSILLFLLRAGWRAPRVVEVPLDQSGWADLRERFFREVHRYSPGQRRGETWEQPLRPLLTQGQRHLAGVARLILAPAGNGHLLPWGVLAERAGWRTPIGQPLPLVTLPALGVLPRLRQRPHAHTGPALVVGNPLGDLPYAEDEAEKVAARFGTQPLLGPAAAKASVLSRLEGASLIHLATHAFFDPQNPLESGIVLAAEEMLTAREILHYRLQADLLVLSACESGQVVSLGGEELAGLSQAFLQAGVRSLLVSLWRVNDPATAALMQAFYTVRAKNAGEQRQPSAPGGKRAKPGACDGSESA